MAAIRIRGVWKLSLSTHTEGLKAMLFDDDVRLVVQKANRAGLTGEVHIGGKSVAVVGKVKPGSPAVVSITEVNADGEPVPDGIEAMLYIPPWWPTVKYDYDLIMGTMVVGTASALIRMELEHKIILVSGIQPFE